MTYTIERVDDIDAAWPDLWRLFRGIVEYHEPLTGERLKPGADRTWRSHLAGMHGLILLARFEDRAIGMALAEARSNPVLGTSYGMLDTVFVEEEHRGRGVGALLTAEVERWCRERGLRRLDLSVRAANADGTAAWRALGFRDESLHLRRDLD